MKRVYLVAGGGYTKVGVSTNLPHRLSMLRTASPVPLRVLADAPGGVALERKLLRAMCNRYEPAEGEWFAGVPTTEEAKEILAEAQALSDLGGIPAHVAYERMERPLCTCHGKPMAWAMAARRRAGGYFRCAVKAVG